MIYRKSKIPIIAIAASMLGACATAQNDTQLDQEEFRLCLNQLRVAATQESISYDTFEAMTAPLTPLPSVLAKLNAQPEVRLSTSQYLDHLIDERRVWTGVQAMQDNQETLIKVQEVYGIPVSTITAVWGIESRYGTFTGKKDIAQSLATLSCKGRRQPFFRKELFSLMRITQRGDLPSGGILGSWAGAFGQTQFMPSTYEKLAVDFDGDGKRDLISSTPDALASTANFLKKAGWMSGKPWGMEVQASAAALESSQGRKDKRSATIWSDLGVKKKEGSALEFDWPDSALIAPDGPEGKAYLVTKNFDAIYKYNASVSYALAISILSDKLEQNAKVAQ